ncbi:von Willebrand factor A [Haematobacter missouriensis]|nr:von Willebrand factor A [Haematobacter missouriensis]
MQFSHPFAFLLLPLPLILFYLLRPRENRTEALHLPEAIAAAGVPVAEGPLRDGSLPLRLALWLFLTLALAGPEWLQPTPDRTATGRDIMLSLDLSGSMETPDFTLDGQTASRLAAVKRVASRFVSEREGDRIGLVIFADQAYVAAPLTHDLAAVVRAIDSAEIGITGRSTAIADGLGLALKRVTAEPATSRVIVLLSDGRDTADRLDARDVGRLAATMGVRVHTIALGPEDLETRPAARDAVDIATLRDIAEASGGRSWRVRNMADLVQMAADLDRLEPNPSSRPPVIVAEALWAWPAALALLLALGVAVAEATDLFTRRAGRAA